jgi:hypothetical protein
MKKNFFLGWTIAQVLVILISSLTPLDFAVAEEAAVTAAGSAAEVDEARLAVARQEFQALRQELAAVLMRAEAQQQEHDRLQRSAAALVARAEVAGQAEPAGLLAAMADITAAGRELVDEVILVSRMLEAALDEEAIPPAERARLRARIAGLRTRSEHFDARIRVPEAAGAWDACRILAVDDRLQVVVVAAGTVHGVGSGLGLRVGEGKDTVRLRVIAVRPHVSAALVVEGDLGQLAPGMTARVGDRGGNE